ncbi:hypothetical protein EMIT048CA2_50111 [Pseudomonas chlororaphis]
MFSHLFCLLSPGQMEPPQSVCAVSAQYMMDGSSLGLERDQVASDPLAEHGSIALQRPANSLCSFWSIVAVLLA